MIEFTIPLFVGLVMIWAGAFLFAVAIDMVRRVYKRGRDDDG